MSFDLKSVLPNFFRRGGDSFAVPGLCRDRKWSLSDYQVAAEDAFCLVPARCDTVRRKERCRRCTRRRSHMMIIISNSSIITNSIIIAASATTTATTTSHTCVALQCGMQVSRCPFGPGACFATQPSAELLQSIQLEVLQSNS